MRHKSIRIEFVPAASMRYVTLGDFWETDDALIIQVSDEVPPNEQYLVALHELIEWKLCALSGITNKQIDDFDFVYQGDGEPGDEPHSPYRTQHRFAMLIEHLMAHEMGVTGYGKVE